MTKETLINYHIRWKPKGQHPGAQPGTSPGIGDQQRAKVLLRDHPDPRRLDIRASIQDPFERLWVRDFYLNTAFKVVVLIDISASMAYQGMVSRLSVTEEITAQLALSAFRSGDAFGVFSANEKILRSACLPVRINRSAWLWVRKQIPKIKPNGKGAMGLMDIIPILPRRKSLIFLISDFRWVDGEYQQILRATQHHDLVPIMLQDPAEVTMLPKNGFTAVRDMETGTQQFIWMRPALREKIQQARQSHLRQVQTLSKRYGIQPFIVNGHFQTGKLNQYFIER